MRILPRIKIFQWRAIQVLADGLFNHSAGHGYEVMVFAGACRSPGFEDDEAVCTDC